MIVSATSKTNKQKHVLGNLPAGVCLNRPVFEHFMQHFVASLLRDACLDYFLPEGEGGLAR